MHERLSNSELLHLATSLRITCGFYKYAPKSFSHAWRNKTRQVRNIAKSARARIRCRKYCWSYRAVSREPPGFLLTYRHYDAHPLVAPIFFYFSPPRVARCVCGDLKLGRYVSHVPICRSITTLVEYLDKDSSANCSGERTKLTCHRLIAIALFFARVARIHASAVLTRTRDQTHKCLPFGAYTFYRPELSMMDFRICNCLKARVLNFHATIVLSCIVFRMNDRRKQFEYPIHM